MKRSVTTYITVLTSWLIFTSPTIAQEEKKEETEQVKAPVQEAAVSAWQDYMNLPKAKRDEFSRKLTKVQNLFNQKRVFDVLFMIDELDEIYPNHPASLNLRGASYIEMRAFDKAHDAFSAGLKISPSNTSVLFNLGEVDFVTKKWDSAYSRFKKLIPLLPKENKIMIHLCEFKLLLCQLKTNRMDEALALKEKYGEWDDTPFFYYARAAILFHQGDSIAADNMLRNVAYIWRDKKTLAPWQDTLIEFGYIRSFYGGDPNISLPTSGAIETKIPVTEKE